MPREFALVIVDDDQWKRTGMRQRLDETSEVRVVDAVDEDTAASWPLAKWNDIDAVLVDVFDDAGSGEIGTDLYSGIKVADRVRRIEGLRCIAVTPECPHPLVQLRLHQAAPDYCYHRFELGDLEALMEAVRFPERDHRPPPPSATTIRQLGAKRLHANDAVRAFETSPLHGILKDTSAHRDLKHNHGISRRAVDSFKQEIIDCGYSFVGVDGRAHDEEPRWPDVRTLVLQLIGRKDAPWSEHDKPWWPT